MLGSFYVSHYTLTTYARKLKHKGAVQPEDRLPPMIVGAAVLPIGLFWFSWTSSPTITPWPQIFAGIPIGAGIQIITLQSLAYLIDIYSVNSASAISGVMIVRSLLGGLFPMIAIPLYTRLGVRRSQSAQLFLSMIADNCRSDGERALLAMSPQYSASHQSSSTLLVPISEQGADTVLEADLRAAAYA